MFATRLLQMAALYLIVGVSMGVGMGMTENFTLAAVHAHVNLLGWATMGLMALIYKAYPAAAETKLAKAHFWLHGGLTPFMLIALAVMLSGNRGLGPVVGILSIFVALGVICYCVNILRFVREARTATAPQAGD
jgi:hypothetical protein